jgi:hypothetical protein
MTESTMITESAITRQSALKPRPGATKPAVQISDADRKRKILPVTRITDKCTMTVKKRHGKGEPFRVA